MYNNYNIENLLIPGEQIIWKEKPNAKRFLHGRYFTNLLFGIPILALLIWLLLSQFRPDLLKTTIESQPFVYVIIAVGLFLTFGNLIIRYYSVKNSEYCFTNKRIFICSDARINRINTSKHIVKNGTEYTRYRQSTSFNKELSIVEERSLNEIMDVYIQKNIYGGLNIKFIHSIYMQKISNLEFHNVKDAELLMDIFNELREKAKYKRYEEAYGEVHIL